MKPQTDLRGMKPRHSFNSEIRSLPLPWGFSKSGVPWPCLPTSLALPSYSFLWERPCLLQDLVQYKCPIPYQAFQDQIHRTWTDTQALNWEGPHIWLNGLLLPFWNLHLFLFVCFIHLFTCAYIVWSFLHPVIDFWISNLEFSICTKPHKSWLQPSLSNKSE
jgi:hypothetical protein